MSAEIIRVLQITDTHLFADRNGCLLGVNTDRSLRSVIAQAASHHADTDLVLATGDLTHDGTPQAYQRFFELMKRFNRPVYCLPGNHDEATTLANMADSDYCSTPGHIQRGQWQFIFLDSTIPGSEHARLDADTLEQLDRQLRASPELHTLVCLHHQPVPMHSLWLDTMAVSNAAEFFGVIDQHPQVRGILWGHVHQTLDTVRNNVQLMSTPSTCIQFLPGSEQFSVDTTTPGYRWLHLHPDGRIETGTERIDETPGTIDMAAEGYL